MVVYNLKSMCEQAAYYYFDYVYNENLQDIPGEIITHITQCQHCLSEMERLKAALAEEQGDNDHSTRKVDSVFAANLQSHFAYIGVPITCTAVKPFLPLLINPALAVAIPTPITTHLDQCVQCTKDMETIQQLNLDHKQLCRLSRLFADKRGEDAVSCSQAHASILAFVTMAFNHIEADVLKHLCTCPDCRSEIHEFRETFQRELSVNEAKHDEFPCEKVSSHDIFDYCFPYDIDPAKDRYAKLRTLFSDHAGTCSDCLARMQKLHETVCGIMERKESGVVTLFEIDQSAKTEREIDNGGIYNGFPIKVKVLTSSDNTADSQKASTVSFITALKQKVAAVNTKPLFKASIAAAAVILIAFGLFFNTSTVKAVTIGRIYEAVEKIKNVCITSFLAGKTEPAQAIWVSRSLNIYMTKTGKDFVLWDIAGKQRKTIKPDTAVIASSPLSGNAINDIEKKITGSLGLMPFDSISKIPGDAQWRQVNDTELSVAGKGVEVYELIWTKKAYDGSVVSNKWRVFVDTKTYSPKKIEWYKKSEVDKEYALDSVTQVTYLSENEMRNVVNDTFF